MKENCKDSNKKSFDVSHDASFWETMQSFVEGVDQSGRVANELFDVHLTQELQLLGLEFERPSLSYFFGDENKSEVRLIVREHASNNVLLPELV